MRERDKGKANGKVNGGPQAKVRIPTAPGLEIEIYQQQLGGGL